MRRLTAMMGVVMSLTTAAQGAWAQVAPAPVADAAGGFSSERLKGFDRLMEREISAGEIAGAVLLLARHGKPVLSKAYGKRDLEAADPMPLNAIFRIRSNTKPVTAVAMMMLYEQGLWTLDDPVTKFIPEFVDLRVATGALDASGVMITEPVARPPTMRELMTHTAGFAYGLGPGGPAETAYYNARVVGSASSREMIEKIAALPMISQPGVRWYYSAATDIQGYIVERLSGMSLADFLDQRVFKPLGMSDTAFFVPAEKTGRLATLYDMDHATRKLTPQPERGGVDITVPPGLASGGGGLMSTAQDYGRFCQMILGHGQLDGVRLLKPETVALMLQNQLAANFMVTSNGTRASPLGAGVGFGLGWAVWLDPAAVGSAVGPGTVSWGGSAGTWFWIDPQNDLYFVGMIQRLGGTGGGLDGATRGLAYSALVDPTK